jgi:hypothetical protein
MDRPAEGQPEPTNIRGRPFEKGNPGRRRGSKNRRSLVSAALLADEEQKLVRKAVHLAEAGDVQMLKFLLGRVLPRERVITVDLPPMVHADDAVDGLGSIMHAVSEGKISPSEGAALATIVNSYSRAIDVADMVKRLEGIETKMQTSGLEDWLMARNQIFEEKNKRAKDESQQASKTGSTGTNDRPLRHRMGAFRG